MSKFWKIFFVKDSNVFEELKNLPRFRGMAHVSNTDYQHVMVSVRNKSGAKAIPKMYKMRKKLDIFFK